MKTKSEIILEFVDKVLSGGDVDATGDYFWEDFVEEVPLPGQGPGLEGLQEVLRAMKAAFPDIHWKMDEQMCDGDRVMSRFVWTGTHLGAFVGIPPTGRPVSVWGVVIDQLV